MLFETIVRSVASEQLDERVDQRQRRADEPEAAHHDRVARPDRATASSGVVTLAVIVLAAAPAPLERERVGAALHRDPAHLGELVHDRGAAEAAEARVLDAPEGHLRLVAHRLVVDVDDARVDRLGELRGRGRRRT